MNRVRTSRNCHYLISGLAQFSLLLSCASFAKGDCSIHASQLDVSGLMKSYVPRGENGRAAAGAVYRTGSRGQILQTLFERNAHVAQPVASTQKIMTAYTAYKSKRLTERVTFSEFDMYYDKQGTRALYPNSNRKIYVGERVAVADLIGTLMIQSSNGASFAIARGVSPTVNDFMKSLNSIVVQILGPQAQSYFQNPSGLTDSSSYYRFAASNRKQQSTAAELSKLAAYVMSESGFRTMLSEEGLLNAKNGYLYKVGLTQAAGQTVVASFPLPKNCGDQRVVYSFFGELSREQFPKFSKLYYELINRVYSSI